MTLIIAVLVSTPRCDRPLLVLQVSATTLTKGISTALLFRQELPTIKVSGHLIPQIPLLLYPFLHFSSFSLVSLRPREAVIITREVYLRSLTFAHIAKMQLPPASVMANWPVPNYENPQTQGLPLIIVNVIFMALISLALPLRLYSRYVTKGRLGWDDFNMTIAYVLLTHFHDSTFLLTHAYRFWVWPSVSLSFLPTFASSGIVIYGMSSLRCFRLHLA